MKHFDFQEKKVEQEIRRLQARRVLLQLPEGLKPEAIRLAKIIGKTGALPIVSADPCYGACDLATEEAEGLGVDLVVHYGHARLAKHERVPTLYVEARANVNMDGAIQKALPLLEKWRKIGLVTTVQHVQTLNTVGETLTKAGKTVAVGDTGQLSYRGQVIGCNYNNATSIAGSVEAFLFAGGGRFHALGVALSTSKPVVVADPFDNRAFSVDKEAQKVVKQRWSCIQEARNAKNLGVLVGLKPGQRKLEEALRLKKKLEENGRTACLFAVRELSPETALGFPAVDAYVNTACPRISLDDASRFRKPVLTVREALVVLGELSWERLCREGLLGN